jgi:NAD+ synthase (glutamine-hydrolysing)
MAQINPTMGDIEGNTELILDYCRKAQDAKVDLVVFPEMAVTGYPPNDLLPPREVRTPAGTRKPGQEAFVRDNKKSIADLARHVMGITIVVGFVDYDDAHLYNSAAIIHKRRVTKVIHKTLLPTYDVFDELRYFTPAQTNLPTSIEARHHRIKLGISICEDIWDEEIGYGLKVVDNLCARGAEMIVNLNASPFHDKIRNVRLRILRKKASRLHVPIFYANMVGGQDELVFDGESIALGATGRIIGIGKQFEEDLVITDITLHVSARPPKEKAFPPYHREKEMFNALVLGVRDYFRKTGFEHAFLGLSGGIDSSLVAAIASTALGKENVTGVSMPSRYSSEHSKTDAQTLATNLGIKFVSIPIEPVFAAFEAQLEPSFRGRPFDVADENLQSRIRGNILMALSNKLGGLVLATGNKTELALGYSTLYGDMSGGLEVIGDVSKTEVYSLARHFNKSVGSSVIPENCFNKIPSAELRPDQFDPFDYSIVSPLVDDVIENRLSRNELTKRGYDKALVDNTLIRIKNAEYKRRQAPPTIKITKKAFGLGWKMPIVNQFKG